MANPNLINTSSIYGNTNYLIPSTTAATTWTALTPAAGTVNKIDNIVASNVTASAVAVQYQSIVQRLVAERHIV